jgi:hypothetical protein
MIAAHIAGKSASVATIAALTSTPTHVCEAAVQRHHVRHQ